jgi:hypothetical protein
LQRELPQLALLDPEGSLGAKLRDGGERKSIWRILRRADIETAIRAPDQAVVDLACQDTPLQIRRQLPVARLRLCPEPQLLAGTEGRLLLRR